jgi:glycosyltransferase involved in cell wall biosynthesis
MKILLIFRERRETPPSIENVFYNLGNSLTERGYDVKFFHLSNRGRFFQLIELLLFVKRHKPSVYHVTGDIHWISLFLPRNRTILTIHDFGPFENGNLPVGFMRRYLYICFWFIFPILYLKKIHLISYTSYEKGKVLFPKISLKSTVIYNMVDTMSRRCFRSESGSFVLLQVGTHKNKNLQLLIDAVVALKDIVRISLNIVGKLEIEHQKYLNEKGISYINKHNLRKDELMEMYCSSDVLFFTSFYEGFGLPIIEAQALGIPVITSNYGAMSEIAGKNAVLINPYSLDEAQSSILMLYNDRSYYNRIRSLGFENVARFSKERITDQFEILYRKINEKSFEAIY